jgi:cation diffusion facilitator CzcD-associated flavoprotein CzcO
VQETSELVIIGGGIAGLNALTVASGYLSAHDRVVLVDSRPRAGGMWVDTYDFVRLHQPYPIFTAGKIAWRLGKPASHLATRDEVLDHLRHCLDVARTEVDLEERFGWEYIDHAEADGVVTVTIRGSDGRSETLTTKRLI